jgi:streptomycin 3"-adenylyltransferase
MPEPEKWPNCDPAVRRQIQLLIDVACEVLGQHLRGIYLHGSLALGGFNVSKSDIDLLFLTRGNPSGPSKREFTQAILDSSNKPCPLELSVLRTDQFEPWQYPTMFDFHYGEAHRAQYSSQLLTAGFTCWNDGRQADPDLAAHFAVCRDRGVALYGEPIETTLPTVPRADVEDSLLQDLAWSRQRITELLAYAILNSCRLGAYFEQGLILSKVEGASWAFANLPERFHPLIRAAQRSSKTGDDLVWRDSSPLRLLDYVQGRIGRKAA